MVLGHHVQSLEVFVLPKLLQDYLLLGELLLQVPELFEVVLAQKDDLRLILHRNYPSHWTRRLTFISFSKPYNVTLNSFLDNYRPHQIDLIVRPDFN